MNLANKCPQCGGIASHIVTDVNGKSYYRCMTGMTTLGDVNGELSPLGHIVPCDTIIDQEGKKFTGTIAYVTDDKAKTLAVTDGKERR